MQRRYARSIITLPTLPSMPTLTHGQPGAAPSLSAQVQAMLAGTTGFAIDPTDPSTMWQEDTKVTQVSGAGQTIGALRTKWGLTQYDFIQATAAARPTWDGTKFIVGDGVDDYLGINSGLAALQNAPGLYIAFRWGGTANNNPFIAISTAAAGTQRVDIGGSSGRMRTRVRRLDGDAVTDDFGTVSAYSGLTAAFEQDFAVNGNAVKYKDNVSVDTYTLAGSPANSSNTASARANLLIALTNTFAQTASLGRMVVLPFVPSSGQRATIQSWLTEV